MVELTIDNKTVTIEEGKTLLDTAKSLGIEIPILCYHPAVVPYGACRLCLVEITREKWEGWSKLVVSCAYPVEEGLIVYTNSEKVIKSRKFILELLLMRCPESEEIQDLAKQYGVKGLGRFYERERRRSPELTEGRRPDSAEGHLSEKTNCILCGLCVRVCDEIVKQHVLSFISRGINRKVLTPFDKSSDICLTCSACANVCPTGAIKLEDILGIRKIEPFKTERELKKCRKCGKYFIPTILFDLLKTKLNIEIENCDCCPECRRKEVVSKAGFNNI